MEKLVREEKSNESTQKRATDVSAAKILLALLSRGKD